MLRQGGGRVRLFRGQEEPTQGEQGGHDGQHQHHTGDQQRRQGGRQSTAGEGHAGAVARQVEVDRHKGVQQGLSGTQPQKAAGQVLPAVPGGQMGQVGEELKIEIEGERREEQVQRVEGEGKPEELGQPPGPLPQAQQDAEGLEQRQLPFLLRQQVQSPINQCKGHPVGQDVQGPQVEAEKGEQIGPGDAGHPAVEDVLLRIHAAPPSRGVRVRVSVSPLMLSSSR